MGGIITTMTTLFRPFFALLLVTVVAGCSWLYRADLVQGLPLSEEGLKQLKVGMSRDDTVRLLGQPQTVSPFRENRVEYVWRLQKGDGSLTEERLTLFFDRDRLSQIQRQRPTQP